MMWVFTMHLVDKLYDTQGIRRVHGKLHCGAILEGHR